MAEILGHPEVMRFSVKGPETRAETKVFLERVIASYESGNTHGLFAVIHGDDDALIGYCGPVPQVVEGRAEVEIGYRLHRAYWGLGLTTEAARAARDYAFDQLGATRLISIIERANVASIRVAEKSGMRHDSDARFYDVPVRIYAMTRAERTSPAR